MPGRARVHGGFRPARAHRAPRGDHAAARRVRGHGGLGRVRAQRGHRGRHAASRVRGHGEFRPAQAHRGHRGHHAASQLKDMASIAQLERIEVIVVALQQVSHKRSSSS